MKSPLIFINYRRDDTSSAAERLFQDLNTHFEPGIAYRDEQSIPLGAYWPQDLSNALNESAAILVLIGSQWEHLRDAQGERRIDASGDWVRTEIEKSLEQGKFIIPVFINCPVLRAEVYPESIRAIHALQGIVLDDTNWDTGMSSIMEYLKDVYDWELRRASFKLFEKQTKTEQGSLTHLKITDTLLADIRSDAKDSEGKEWVDTAVEVLGEQMPLKKAITRLWQERERHILLIGEGGMGKTVSLVRLWESLLEQKKGPVPLFVSLERFNAAENQTNFIEDALLKDHYGATEETNRQKLRDIWQQRGLNEQPRAILLLDGLNEINQAEKIPEALKKQLLRLFNDFQGLQIVITSRYPSLGYSLREVDQFTNLYLSHLTPEKINQYLYDQDILIPETANIRNVLYNPLLLTLYVKTTNESRRYANLVQDFYKPEINTKGELLWNFTMLNLGKQLKQWTDDDVRKDFAVYLVRVFLPWLGYRMERAERYSIAGDAKSGADLSLTAIQLLRECLDQYKPSDLALITNDRLKNRSMAGISEEELLFFAARHLKLLIEMPNITGADKLPNITFRFLHQEFRSFFAGVYLIGEMRSFCQHTTGAKPSKRVQHIPSSLRNWLWNTTVSRYVGEISGEYQNAPRVEKKRWIKPNYKTEINETLDQLRNIFKPKLVGYSVINIIAAIRAVRDDFSGEDFSRLYLEGIRWQNICLSHINGESFFACNFLDSVLDPKDFFPFRHLALSANNYPFEFPDCIITHLEYIKNGTKIVSATKNEKIIWDTTTKKGIKMLTNEKIIPNDWLNLMLGYLPVYATFGDERYAITIVSLINQKQGQKLYELTGEVDMNFIQPGLTGDSLYDENASIDIWDLKYGRLVVRYPNFRLGWMAHTKGFEKIAVHSPDGKEIYLVEALTGNILHSIGFSIPTKCVSIHPFWDKILVVGADHSVREIDLNTGNPTATLPFDSLKEFVLGYSPDGSHVLTCNYEHYISNDYKKQLSPVLLEYHGQKKKDFGQIKVWNIHSGAIKRTFKSHEGLVRKYDFYENKETSDVFLLSGSDNGEVFEWNFYSGEILKAYSNKHKPYILMTMNNHLALSTFFISSQGGSITFFKNNTLNPISLFKGKLFMPFLHFFSRDGKKVLIIDMNYNLSFLSNENTDETRIEVWNIETGSLIKKLNGAKADISIFGGMSNACFDLSGDRILVWESGYPNSTLVLYDLNNEKADPILTQEIGMNVKKVVFTPYKESVILIEKGRNDGFVFLNLRSNELKRHIFPKQFYFFDTYFNEVLGMSENNSSVAMLLRSEDNEFVLWLLNESDIQYPQIAFRFVNLNVKKELIPSVYTDVNYLLNKENKQVLQFVTDISSRGNEGGFLKIEEYDLTDHQIKTIHFSEDEVLSPLNMPFSGGKEPYNTDRGRLVIPEKNMVIRLLEKPVYKYELQQWEGNELKLKKQIPSEFLNLTGCKMPYIRVSNDPDKAAACRILEMHGAEFPDKHHFVNYPHTNEAHNINRIPGKENLANFLLGIIRLEDRIINLFKKKAQKRKVEPAKGLDCLFISSEEVD